MNASTPVVVLHIHHGSLGIARTLGRWAVPVYAVDRERDTPALSSRYFRGTFQWDFAAAGAAESVRFLNGLGRRIGRRSILIPAADDLVLFVAENASALEEWFLFPDLAPDVVRSLINKKELYFLARKLGIPTPETRFPESVADVREFARDARFPVMLKGIDGARLQARSGVKMVIVPSAHELVDEYVRLEDPAGPNLMLQEYIPGGDDSVWMLDGYFNDASECLVAFTGRKLHQFPAYKGATSLGVCLPNDEVRRLTLEFARGVGYRGILDIGFRHDRRDDSYKLLDPNPRVGCTFRLFVGSDGMDVVRALYLDLTGQEVPPSPHPVGRKWMVENWELDSCRDYVRDGYLTARECLRAAWGTDELAWFADDDPIPFFRMVGERAARAVGGVARRLRLGGMPGGTNVVAETSAAP